MNKLSFLNFLLAVISFSALSSCNRNSQKPPSGNANDTVLYYPYAPVYANGFQKGDPEHAQKVLAIWKELESGDLIHRSGYFADSISIILPDRIMRGKKDSILRMMRKRWETYSDVQCYIDAWLSVHPNNRKEELVLLWGRQDLTEKNGKREYQVLHEIWRFNTQGKIISWEQYQTHSY